MLSFDLLNQKIEKEKTYLTDETPTSWYCLYYASHKRNLILPDSLIHWLCQPYCSSVSLQLWQSLQSFLICFFPPDTCCCVCAITQLLTGCEVFHALLKTHVLYGSAHKLSHSRLLFHISVVSSNKTRVDCLKYEYTADVSEHLCLEWVLT